MAEQLPTVPPTEQYTGHSKNTIPPTPTGYINAPTNAIVLPNFRLQVSRHSVHRRQIVTTSGTNMCLGQVQVSPREINENTTVHRRGEIVCVCMETTVLSSLPAMPLPSAV